jgi:hypothetical protein
MKIFQRASDGGKDSGVSGFFLVEIKALFSIVVLRFNNGTREAIHSHAFNAVTWFLKGRVREHRLIDPVCSPAVTVREFGPSWRPKFTPRDNHHKVESLGVSWALSFRGPWVDRWREVKHGKLVTLTHGRKVVNEYQL